MVVDEVVAEGTAPVPQEAVGTVASRKRSGPGKGVAGCHVQMTDLRRCISDEDVVVGAKIIPLKGYEAGVEVVEVGNSTVVPSGPRTIQELREREVGLGVPVGPRV